MIISFEHLIPIRQNRCTHSYPGMGWARSTVFGYGVAMQELHPNSSLIDPFSHESRYMASLGLPPLYGGFDPIASGIAYMSILDT